MAGSLYRRLIKYYLDHFGLVNAGLWIYCWSIEETKYLSPLSQKRDEGKSMINESMLLFQTIKPQLPVPPLGDGGTIYEQT